MVLRRILLALAGACGVCVSVQAVADQWDSAVVQESRVDSRVVLGGTVVPSKQVTIAAQPVSVEEASSFGILLFDHEGHVVDFVEKPDGARIEQVWLVEVPYTPQAPELRPALRHQHLARGAVHRVSKPVAVEVHERLAHRREHPRERDGPAIHRPRGAVHRHAILPGRERRAGQQDFQILAPVQILYRNSEVGFHNPMLTPALAQVTRARSRARGVA